MEVRTRAPEWALDVDVIQHLDVGELLNEKWEVRKVKNKTERFTLIDGALYRQGFLAPLLRCVSLEKSQYILAEIHEGVCGNHYGGRALEGKVVKASYNWPQTLKDVEEFIRKCIKCQLSIQIPHCLSEELTSIILL